MKKIMLTLIAILTLTVSARAMSYEQARNEALFLTDKMAYELNLTDAQYEAAYEINLDYLMGVTSRHDVYGTYWDRRNMDLQYILYTWQWDLFRAATYFYRPLYWDAGYWHFGVYARYPHRDYFYFGRPHFYVTYRGGHSWRMNGGRSYYVHHRDHFRPDIHRDHHIGMRDGWNRGDYRNNHKGSSTRITGNGHNRTGFGNHDNDRNGMGNHHNSNNSDRSGMGNHHNNNSDRSGLGNRDNNNNRNGGMGNREDNGSNKRTGFGSQHNDNSFNRSLPSHSTGTTSATRENRSTIERSQNSGVRMQSGSVSRSASTVNRSASTANRSASTVTRSASTVSRSSAAASGGMRSNGGSRSSGSSNHSSGSFGRHR
jgi:hypothetical protein